MKKAVYLQRIILFCNILKSYSPERFNMFEWNWIVSSVMYCYIRTENMISLRLRKRWGWSLMASNHSLNKTKHVKLNHVRARRNNNHLFTLLSPTFRRMCSQAGCSTVLHAHIFFNHVEPSSTWLSKWRKVWLYSFEFLPVDLIKVELLGKTPPFSNQFYVSVYIK